VVPTPTIEWAVASRAMPGETNSGDRYLVAPFANGMLIAVIDGLGHGTDAAKAAELASATLARDPSEPAIGLMKRCHQALIGTRGAAISLACVDTRHGVINWLSVGNVEGMLFQNGADGKANTSRLVTRGGVVGSALPQLRAEGLALSPGDMLIFATDGVDSRFAETFKRDRRALQDIANHLLADFAKQSDDALVLIARPIGGG